MKRGKSGYMDLLLIWQRYIEGTLEKCKAGGREFILKLKDYS